MAETDAEVIVVGGGIVGLWTAYLLAQQGIKTILFEQFPYPHTRGSSHGQSRLIRYAYCEEEYASMISECFRKWRQLEKDSGKELLLEIGLICIFDMYENDHVSAFYGMMDTMDKFAPDVEVIPGQDLEKRFPGLRCDSKFRGIFDRSAGLLKADKCLLALQDLFVKHGGHIRDGESVLSINPINETKVEVKTMKKTFSCRTVVLACGPFTNRILSSVGIQLPLQVQKPTVFYWKDKSTSQMYSVAKNYPGTSLHKSYYSIPSYEYPGLMKICYDAFLPLDSEIPNFISLENQDKEKKRMTEFKQRIKENFPEIDPEGPVIKENCIYTRTPDCGFIIDRHPKHRNIIIGAGFSGHGFKTSPAVGHMLANMALGLQPPYSQSPFAIARFNNKSML